MQALGATTIASIPTAAPLTPRALIATPVEDQAPAPPAPSPMPAQTRAPQNAPQPAQPAAIQYTVQAGDTLLAIAYRHNVSMAAIQLANDMGDSQIVRLGDTLTIPLEKIAPDESAFWIVHIVRAGETLSSIGQLYGVSAGAMVRINQLADVDAIHINQKLVVPLTTLFVATRPTPKPPAVAATTVAPVLAAPTQSTAQPATEASAPPQISYSSISEADAFRARLLELHNAERAAAGVPPLVMSPLLQQSAQLHAQDCAARGFGSHTGSDGSTSRARIARAGFTGRITGENWAFGRSPDQVFDMWFHQEHPNGPHRLNILSARYTEVGFGIADAGNGRFYFIANFGAP